MESIYYVMCFACHRRCKHCYEDRFRPYVRDELAAVVAETKANHARIIDHFPDRTKYLDLADPAQGGTLPAPSVPPNDAVSTGRADAIGFRCIPGDGPLPLACLLRKRS